MRARLAAGETLLGTMVFEFATLGLPRIAASAGAEFVLLDLEHTGWSLETLRPVLAAARADDIVPLVRVRGARRDLVSPALDAGAGGVMVPMVETPEQAVEVVEAARFAPEGSRGFGLLYPDQRRPDLRDTLTDAGHDTLVICQIETAAGLERVDEIAAVPGVDVLWVGLFDLTISLHVPGRWTDPSVETAVDRVLAACGSAGRTPGLLTAGVEDSRAAIERGFRMIAVGTDIGLYAGALEAGLRELRQSQPNA